MADKHTYHNSKVLVDNWCRPSLCLQNFNLCSRRTTRQDYQVTHQGNNRSVLCVLILALQGEYETTSKSDFKSIPTPTRQERARCSFKAMDETLVRQEQHPDAMASLTALTYGTKVKSQEVLAGTAPIMSLTASNSTRTMVLFYSLIPLV